MLTRRSFVAGLIAAPAIVKVQSIMPVKAIDPEWLSGIDYGAGDDFTAVVLRNVAQATQIPVGRLLGKPTINEGGQLVGMIEFYNRSVINMIVNGAAQVGEEVMLHDRYQVRSLSRALAQEENDGASVGSRQSDGREDDA